jgi:hypothetical protein
MGMRLGWRLVVVLLAATEGAHGADAANPFSEADLAFFEKRVRPILVERCQECHSARHDKVHGGLVLDRRERILQGGDSGPAVRPGQPDESLLLEAVRYERSDLQMPPDGKLPEAEIAILATWIERGLAFPSDPTAPRPEPAASAGTAAEHWSFQPFRSVDLPSLPAADLAWPRTRIDWFVRAG